MGLLSALGRLFWRTEEHPPHVAGDFAPDGLEREDGDEMLVTLSGRYTEPATRQSGGGRTPHRGPATGAERIDDDLFGISFAIEYVDSRGGISHRRVTMHDAWRGKDDIVYLRCLCHERKAARTFRFDRIRHVIDIDGVVHQPALYFADELQIDLPPEAADSSAEKEPDLHVDKSSVPKAIVTAPPPDAAEKPGLVQRRVARDGIRLLIGLARSDGELHPAELEIVLDYVEGRCEREGVGFTDSDRHTLVGYLKRQHPTVDVLQQCLDRMDQESNVEQRHFAVAALALAKADGVEDEAEFAMLRQLGVTS